MKVSRFDTLADAVTYYLAHIDTEAGRVRGQFVSPGTLIDAEYRRAADTAATFKADGYGGTPPSPVQAWADAAGMTPAEAADDIIAAREAMNAALDEIRVIRLAAKEQVRAATTPRDVLHAAERAIEHLNAMAP